MENVKIDQITLDIIKGTLQAIGEETFISVARSSKSPVIYEVLDFTSGITDANGNLLTQGNGITGFIGMLSSLSTEVLKRFNKNGNLKKGDIIISNDPYSGGGSHLSDVNLAMPVFYDDHLVAMAVNKAHWTEVGGKEVGSWSVDATEVFQEGLQFPFIKICNEGVMNEAVLELIKANVRFPDQSIGDMWAQIAGLKTAEKRIIEICDKYSMDTFLYAMDQMLKTSEEASLNNLKKLPKGVFEAEEWIEDDGLGSGPIRIKVKVTITDEKFIVDFTGTDKQVRGPINLTYAALLSSVRIIYLAITDHSQEINDGIFKPLELIVEEGSILNAKSPASVSICWESMLPATDAICKAIAPLLPNKLTASNYCTVGAFILACMHPETKEQNVNVAPSLGGWGAGLGMDGMGGQFSVGNGETYNIPVEILENRYGFFVEEYKLNTGVDAGAGEFRGGPGVIRQYKMRSDNNYFSSAVGRFKNKPWGLNGGQPGSNNFMEVIRRDGQHEGPMPRCVRVKMDEGDALRYTTAVGGGYGNPLLRPIDKVEMDAKNEYITLEQAEKIYGVILDPDTFNMISITNDRKAMAKS